VPFDPVSVPDKAVTRPPTKVEFFNAAATSSDTVYRVPTDRLAADRDLYDRLKAANFTGPEYDKFANELAAYAISVVTAWLVSGEMFKLCTTHSRSVGSRPSSWTQHDIAGLVNDTVIAALINFQRRGLTGAGWEYSEDAASLTTYFLTACVLEFPNVYRKWERGEQHWYSHHDLCETFDDAPTEAVGAPDVATTVVRRQEAANAYAGLSERERLIAYCEFAGYRNAEIAELLKMTSARAVEGALYRIRRKANKRREQEGGEHA
jgi:DNA-directed RNA polymerase specialized sigma24 family protein